MGENTSTLSKSPGNIKYLIGETNLSDPHNILQHLGQLAREYDRKYRELEEFAQHAQPEDLKAQLRALGERTTDRFRAAQQALLALPANGEGGEQQLQIEALMALSSCFDEMRILFQIMLDRLPQA
jgi:hypothetical protein